MPNFTRDQTCLLANDGCDYGCKDQRRVYLVEEDARKRAAERVAYTHKSKKTSKDYAKRNRPK